ncbi:hypothetical protein AB0C98_10525 [Streptomyces sp. NPDC048558]|uniref:hypothetical protein n=1 Tax=Streptomyces sp. NPDC048558 TaxID=3155759 RepID=UPI0033C35C1E
MDNAPETLIGHELAFTRRWKSALADLMPTQTTAGAQPRLRRSLHRSGLPDELVAMQQAADDARLLLLRLDDHEERDRQRRAWFVAAGAVQDAVTRHARAKGLNRYEVKKRLRQVVRPPETEPNSAP